jgi:RNA polymerase sigma factor (sigma-70 family)
MIEDKYEVINDLIKEYKAKKNQSLLFQILDFYKPLFLSSVKRCIQKDNRLSRHREDFPQEFIFVLKKLVDNYDPDLSYFSYYLSTRIDINLFRYLTEKYFHKEELSEEHTFEEKCEDPFNNIDTVITLHEAVNKLPEKSKEVITIYFFEEFDQKEAAEKLGITQGAFSKRLSKALEQLKSMLGEDFLFD